MGLMEVMVDGDEMGDDLMGRGDGEEVTVEGGMGDGGHGDGDEGGGGVEGIHGELVRDLVKNGGGCGIDCDGDGVDGGGGKGGRKAVGGYGGEYGGNAGGGDKDGGL